MEPPRVGMHVLSSLIASFTLSAARSRWSLSLKLSPCSLLDWRDNRVGLERRVEGLSLMGRDVSAARVGIPLENRKASQESGAHCFRERTTDPFRFRHGPSWCKKIRRNVEPLAPLDRQNRIGLGGPRAGIAHIELES